MRARDGYASWTAEFDATGNWVTTPYFDGEGKPVRTRPVIAEVEAETQAAVSG